MDVFGGYSESTNSSRDEIGVGVRASSCAKKKQKKRRNDPLKIVYISSPMKVKTCESQFRSLVKELTGKDSQVAMFMDVSSSRGTTKTSQLPAVVSDPTSLQVAGVFERGPV
uniref:VQ domain-containing protein n=1 Tax=Kalanchoe fedtschenkoi TaxID=63787 RepID=A0A7N0UDQ6_KALFE